MIILFQSFFSTRHAILGNYNPPLSLKLNDVTLTDQQDVDITLNSNANKNRLKKFFIGRGACMGDSLSYLIVSCYPLLVKLFCFIGLNKAVHG